MITESSHHDIDHEQVPPCTGVSSEAWAKLRELAILAGRGRLLLSGSIVLKLKAAVFDINKASISDDRLD